MFTRIAVISEGEEIDGAICIVRVDGEATVKRVYRRGDQAVLQPVNPKHTTIQLHADQDIRIEGKVVGKFIWEE